MDEGLTLDDVAPMIGAQALHIKTLEKQLAKALQRVQEREEEGRSASMKPPEGAVIEAIWRCKRGHDSPASWSLTQTEIGGVELEYPRDGRVTEAADLLITRNDGSRVSICVDCLAEDYGTERIDFKEG